MNLRVFSRTAAALTLIEVLVVISIIAVLVAILLPALASGKKKSSRLGCVNCLKQISLAGRIWSGDNEDKYPMAVSTATGGAMELVATGDVVSVFQVMSNELSTPKILYCPNDTEHSMATNFGSGLTSRNISYFVGLDASANFSQAFLSGDDNFQVDGVPVKSGLLTILSIRRWDGLTARHRFAGNVGLVYGNVESVRNSDLTKLVQQTGLATNRLAIP